MSDSKLYRAALTSEIVKTVAVLATTYADFSERDKKPE